MKNVVARGHRVKYKIRSESSKEKINIAVRITTCSPPPTPFTELETQKKVKIVSLELPEVKDSKKNNFALHNRLNMIAARRPYLLKRIDLHLEKS